jgi:hypothetical protein
MAFLNIDGEYYWMDGDGISVDKVIKKKIWKMVPTKMGPKLAPLDDFKLSHGKIYGNSQVRANHIVEAFKKNDAEHNLGVLLSGGRGLGKTLTTRLVIEQLKDDYPVVVISEYMAGMADFLSHLKNTIILMDEFEKFMSGNIKGDDNSNEQTKQESILSVLDGNTGSAGNLYLLTVNNTYKLDENLISRPGRIRYHYVYESEDASVVRAYCADNLNDKSKIDEVVSVLGSTKYVSMDIISSFVDELNKFPELSPSDVREYFNLDVSNTKLKYSVLMKTPDGNFTYSTTYSGNPNEIWLHLSHLDYKKLLKAKGIKEESDEADELDYMSAINITIEDLPPVYGVHKLLPDELIVNYLAFAFDANLPFDDSEGYEVLSATITDPEFASYTKKYNKGAF